MTDYINRQAAIDAVNGVLMNHIPTLLPRYEDMPLECARAIMRIASADVEPVKRGKWEITEAYPHNVHCSVCHKRYAQTHWAVWEDGSLPRAYCPNCGAKMDAEEADHASL